MSGRRHFLALSAGCALCGCSGAMHRLPSADASRIQLAATEVTAEAALPRRVVGDHEARATIARVHRRLQDVAVATCHEMGVGVCGWHVHVLADRSMNASAGPGGVIAIHHGIVEHARNDEEVALVLGHEIGHQAANHIANSQRNVQVGAVIGALLLGAAAAYLGAGSPYSGRIVRDATELGGNVGAVVGRISFSREQEREADYIAAVILHRAGYDLDRARGFLLTLARASTRMQSGMFDTHPAGPERVAAWDLAVEEIRRSGGALPARA